MKQKKTVRVISLLSGGLDSCLAIRVLQQQQIDVTGLSFVTPFFSAANARKAAKQLDIPLMVKDITVEHFQMVKNPRYGYGKAMNPCIDCHALMLNVAGRIMEEKHYDAIATGEVLGQRPMSQNKDALHIVAKRSGYAEYVLRPLSAQLLPETKLEQEGIIDRSKLLRLNGRSRKPQLSMAAEMGVTEFPNPAGGCLLTDKGFGIRLRDLLDHDPDPEIRQLELLRFGRHMRLSKLAVLIVGRDKRDNKEIRQRYDRAKDSILTCDRVPGPTCLLIGAQQSQQIEQAAQICVAYSDVSQGQVCPVSVTTPHGNQEITVTADKQHRVFSTE